MLVDNSLMIIGCGGHARSIADVALFNGYKELLFIDENAKKNEKIFGFNVVNNFSSIGQSSNVLFGIGDNIKRKEYFAMYQSKIKLISIDAYIGIDVCINRSTFVGHNAYIGSSSTIGKNSIINTHAIIEHECLVGMHTHIAVNATVAGKCRIGDFVFIGAGATIRDKVSICSNVTVGCGSVVVHNITEPGVYVGIPAKKIKSF